MMRMMRRNVALGFVGRRAAEKYLRETGVSVSESVVRTWNGLYSRWTPKQETVKTPMMNWQRYLAPTRPLQMCKSLKLRCAYGVLCRELHLQTSKNPSDV